MELRVERVVTEDELVRAVAQTLGIDRERLAVRLAPCAGDFAVRAQISAPPFDPRALAGVLATRLLADDGEGDPRTALLVTADDAVRVNVTDGAITGLHEHVDTDDVPDRLIAIRQTFTRGDQLRMALDAAPLLEAGAPPELQDAEHALVAVLRALVGRPATLDDERTVRRTTGLLRRAGAEAISDILRCADAVLAAPWDPAAPA